MKILNENMKCDFVYTMLNYISDTYTLMDRCYVTHTLNLIIAVKSSSSWKNKVKYRYYLLPYDLLEHYIPVNTTYISTTRFTPKNIKGKTRNIEDILIPFNNYHRAIPYEKAFNQFAYLLI